jgi:hypothetical protein
MKANIIAVEKATMPRFDAIVNIDVPTVVVVSTVQFINDDGTLHYEQSYAALPNEVPADAYQLQANAMQADIEHAKVQSIIDEQSKAADNQVLVLQALVQPKVESLTTNAQS